MFGAGYNAQRKQVWRSQRCLEQRKEEEEEVLLFDIDIEEESAKEPKVEPTEKRFSAEKFYRRAVNEFLQASDPVAEKVNRDVQAAKTIWNDANTPPGDCGCQEEFVAAHLKSLGYSVIVCWYSLMSQDVDSVLSVTHNPEKNNRYLSVTPSCKDYDMDEFILEFCFKEQFVIQNPSQRYSEFLSLVPEEFVGTSENLHSLLVLICDEMARAFSATGRSVPPWRRHGAILARWTRAPNFSKDNRKMLCDPHPESFKILSGRQVCHKPKRRVSLLSVDLAARKSKDQIRKTVGVFKGSRFIVERDTKKSVYPSVPKLKMPVKLAQGIISPGLANPNMECMWADALIAQLNRGWFGVA